MILYLECLRENLLKHIEQSHRINLLWLKEGKTYRFTSIKHTTQIALTANICQRTKTAFAGRITRFKELDKFIGFDNGGQVNKSQSKYRISYNKASS